MGKILVIVESPSKCNKISTILNSIDKNNTYIVKASMGHTRDLPSSSFGIDINKDHTEFTATYEIMPGKEKTIKDLKKCAKECDDVILAADLDREGEGIAYHLAKILKLTNPTRIIFNEITKTAIQKALENPVTINEKMVNAYQTRRLLDRIIGYKLSPVVKNNIVNENEHKISAGRTQSILLKLICDKEDDIAKFESSGYYNTVGTFIHNSNNKLTGTLDTKFKSKPLCLDFLKMCKKATYKISKIHKKTINNKPSLPFTTSTLQQEANNKLNYPIEVTQSFAQKLYEQGYITYIRTDSAAISEEFLPTIEKYVKSTYGNEYFQLRQQDEPIKTKKKVVESQDAHECIRPTNLKLDSSEIFDDGERKLYNLIWKRTVASQMSNKLVERTTLMIDISNVQTSKFVCETDVTTFKGFTIVYDDSELNTECELDKYKASDSLNKKQIISTEKFTQPPSKYTESTIIKELEKKGIGRPSTYVSSYQTNINRNYIVKENKASTNKITFTITLDTENIITEVEKEQSVAGEKNKLYSTPIGQQVNKFLNDNFNDVINYEFTANMEQGLDKIANGEQSLNGVLGEFYNEFYPKIKEFNHKSSTSKSLGEYKNKEIYLKVSKYGHWLQWGETDNVDKFKTTISEEQYTNLKLDGAIKIIDNRSGYPKTLGTYKKTDITMCKGPYGFYLKYNNKNYNISDNCELKLEDAIILINKTKDYPKELGKHKKKTIMLYNGPYGLYLKYNNKNFKIPEKKEVDLKRATELISKS